MVEVNIVLCDGILEYGNNLRIILQEQIIPEAGGSHKHRNIPSISRTNLKWLNIVLDLNGILCVCLKERLLPRGQTYVVGKKPHSGIVPYFVGPKAVYVYPSYGRFLRELGNVVDITI
jgi:hypothetical protein